MELRRIFDTIPEQFDLYRSRYCDELFADLISVAEIGPAKTVLELGPGTGQATEPVLRTDCSYSGIELGEHLAQKLREKYGAFPQFHLICDDFITHNFGAQQFDLIYSAATIQWIPEEIAFSKSFSLLKPGGVLAMMMTHSDYKTPNEALYQKIQKVYDAYFRPAVEYPHRGFAYDNAVKYGFTDFEKRTYSGRRVFTAEEYVGYCGTHCDHLVIPEPYKTLFFNGLRDAVLEAGDRIVFHETYILYLARKPLEQNKL